MMRALTLTLMLTSLVCSLGLGDARKRKRDRVIELVDAAHAVARRVQTTAQTAWHNYFKEQAWWTNAVIYQVQLSSFMDSDGDGVGDVRGIKERLTYLQSLGVQAILVSQPFIYPEYGAGYGFTEDRQIDPVYGDIGYVRELIAAVHSLEMYILLDFVPNRLSPQHFWFEKSIKREGEYSDYFVWSPATGYDDDGDPVPPTSWVDINDRNIWIWNKQRKEFYLAHASEHLPVLKLSANERLATELMNGITFWLDMGVDGFHVDSLEFLCEERHFQKYIDSHPEWIVRDRSKISLDNNYKLPDRCHLAKTFADKVGDYIQSDKKPRLVLVDSFGGVEEQIRHYDGKEIDGNPRFVVPINLQLQENINQGSQAPHLQDLIETWMDNMVGKDVPNWIMGSQDTGHLASKMGPEFLGPMNMLLLTLPGIAIVNMGQEIGMRNAFIRKDLSRDSYALMAVNKEGLWQSRDPYRTPMQWDDSTSAGFSTNPKTWLPVHPNYYSLNVRAAELAKESELKLFRAMAGLKNSDYTLKHGCTKVFSPDPYILVVKRYLWDHPSYILVINTDLEIREAYISGYGPRPEGDTVTVVLTSLYSNYKPGDKLQAPLYSMRLLPKSAVLLKTKALRKRRSDKIVSKMKYQA